MLILSLDLKGLHELLLFSLNLVMTMKSLDWLLEDEETM